jgi:Flp pilus assembly pilin Flp
VKTMFFVQRRLLKSERGQTLVEMALVLPLLCLLILGIVEFGRIFNTYLVVTNASREGARAAAVGKGDTQVVAAVKQAAITIEADQLVIVIDPPGEERVRGNGVQVEVRYDLPLVAPVITSMLPNPFPIRAAATMRVE